MRKKIGAFVAIAALLVAIGLYSRGPLPTGWYYGEDILAEIIGILISLFVALVVIHQIRRAETEGQWRNVHRHFFAAIGSKVCWVLHDFSWRLTSSYMNWGLYTDRCSGALSEDVLDELETTGEENGRLLDELGLGTDSLPRAEVARQRLEFLNDFFERHASEVAELNTLTIPILPAANADDCRQLLEAVQSFQACFDHTRHVWTAFRAGEGASTKDVIGALDTWYDRGLDVYRKALRPLM